MSDESEPAGDDNASVIPEYAREIAVRPQAVPWGIVAVVAVKIAGLVSLMQALPLLYLIPSYAFAFASTGTEFAVQYLLTLLVPMLHLAVGVFLIWRAHWVAVTVLGFAESREEFAFRAPGRRFQALAYSVLGVWVAVWGASELIGVVARGMMHAQLSGYDATRDDLPFDWSEVSGPLVKLAAGVWLFFGAKRLAHYWHRFRMSPKGPQAAPEQ